MKEKECDACSEPIAVESEAEVCRAVEDHERHYRDHLPDVVAAIVASCRGEAAGLAHVDSTLLPSKEEVARLVRQMLELVFPGFYGEKEVDLAALPYHVGEVASDLMERLGRQISRSIRHECLRNKNLCSHCLETGQRDALEFLRALPEVRRLSAGDVRAAFRGDPAAKSLDEVVFCYPGLYAVTVYRLAHVIHGLGVPILPRMMTEQAHGQTGIDIHPGATIGEEFFIDHGTGVVIGETSLIGDRVRIYQGVTLGALSFQRDAQGEMVRGTKRHPTIEDDAVVYSGATILGGETVVGKGSVVGGNVWLTRSIPPGTKVTIATPELVIRETAGE